VVDIIDLRKENEMLRAENAALKFRIAEFERMIFGSKSEKFIPVAGQIPLFDVPEESIPPVVKTIEKHQRVTSSESPKGIPSRDVLPAHLPRIEKVIEPEGKDDSWVKIGEEISEVLEYTPPVLGVLRTIRPKYKVVGEQSLIKIADLPSRPIEKGMPGPKLLAYIIVSKFVDHLPLYRQIQILKRLGIELSASTVGGWVEKSCCLLELLYDELKKEVLSALYLQADETTIKVQDKTKKGTTHQGYYWVYHSPEKHLALFDYRPGRSREGPRDILQDFKGFLQTDGYGAYNEYSKNEKITLVGCMAHARRYFEKAKIVSKVLAEEAMIYIQKLYEIERIIVNKELKNDEIVKIRTEKALPILNDMHKWLEDNVHLTTPKSPIGIAFNYSLKRWDKLKVYISNANLNIDNNLVENSIRPVALGRKNYLFAGSHKAAQRSAMLYSFMLSCKMNDVNPQEWLTYVLNNIAETKKSDLYKLLPTNYKK